MRHVLPKQAQAPAGTADKHAARLAKMNVSCLNDFCSRNNVNLTCIRLRLRVPMLKAHCA